MKRSVLSTGSGRGVVMLRATAVALCLVAVDACCAGDPIDLPSPVSQEQPGGTVLMAGVHGVDITPPPGFGLFGYGTEARMSAGYRTRLHARALVLKGSNGELVAIAVADLALISTLLHRRVAERVHEKTDGVIGADRLILTATHTHSGPGHCLSGCPLNTFGSSVMGYDSVLLDWLSDRIAAAVVSAYESLEPARAGWAITNVWGHTRNRSYEAYRLNADAPAFPIEAPDHVFDEPYRAINPRWAMLRVDIRDASTGAYVPTGALSVFAIHGTGFASGNDLYEADIHGLVAAGLERHIGPHGVHLFANGAEGDVSPGWPPETRCDAARLEKERRPGGPRVPPAKDDWHEAPEVSRAACVAAAKRYVKYVGNALADTAIRMFEDLGAHLQSDLMVQRQFETIDLTSPELRQEGLCGEPLAGTATAAGAPDGESRFVGWRILGLFPLGIEAGGHAVKADRTDCQRPKRTLFGFAQSRLVGRLGWPEYTQLTVLRVGDMLIGTVPGEATTVAGLRMMAAIRDARPAALPADNLTILGFTNGDLRYITTREEFAAQYYEGGSTLYGPHTARVLRSHLARLTQRLGSGEGEAAPEGMVGHIRVQPGKDARLWPEWGPPPADLRLAVPAGCQEGVFTVRWFDAPPGGLVPADGLIIAFSQLGSGATAVDGDIDVEVRYMGKQRGGHMWESRWSPQPPVRDGDQVKATWLRWEGWPTVTAECHGGDR